jgi:small subunit ribosomal protein S1
LTGIEQGPPADENPTQPSSAEPSANTIAGNQENAEGQSALQASPPAGNAGDEPEGSVADRRRILIGSQRDPAAYRARRQRDWIPVEGEDRAENQGEGPQSPMSGKATPSEQGGKGQQSGEGKHRRRHRGGRGHHDRGDSTSPQQRDSSRDVPANSAGMPEQAIQAAEQAVIVQPAPVHPNAVPPNAVPPGEPTPVAAVVEGTGRHAGRHVPMNVGGAPSQQSASTATAPQPIAPASGHDAQDDALRASTAALAGADLANLDTLSMPRRPLPPPEPFFPEPVLRSPAALEDEPPVIPGRRQKLTPTMEAELDRAMGGMSLDDLMSGGEVGGQEGGLEPESRHRGRVVALRRDEVFVEFGGREQGCVSAQSFETLPEPGDTVEVIIQRYNAEEGLYDLTLPGVSVELGNWDEVHPGMLVDVQITGHNTGGLECEVSHIRGFIPASQISLYRVEDLAQFVGQHFSCLITDANPARKNLVLSRRAVLEREKEENKKIFFESLAPGQVYEGTVRKLMDFGAFVELGNGVDGLLHISQLSWGRIKHPSEVLQEGQVVRVRVEKIDRETGRIGLSYREMTENPWTSAASKYPHNATVRGKVTRLMEFGAFVELEPGIEGLVHISELSHKRVWRASDVVKEGEEIEVLVLSVNPEAQRMSLSIKGLSKPEPTKQEKAEAQEAESPVVAKKSNRPSNQPLRGGLGKTSGGESLGLKW